MLEQDQPIVDALEKGDNPDSSLLAMQQTGPPREILHGKRILVTRTREQAGVLSERLRALGAISIEFPTIRIVPPRDWEALDRALAPLFPGVLERDEYHDCPYAWVVFTSANGVNICCERLLELGYNLRAMRKVRIAAIGPATAAALTRYGICADLVPEVYIAESVAAALIHDVQKRGESLEGKRILLPRAAEARKVLVTELQQAGASVDEVAAYTTVSIASNDRRGGGNFSLFPHPEIDNIKFISFSTV